MKSVIPKSFLNNARLILTSANMTLQAGHLASPLSPAIRRCSASSVSTAQRHCFSTDQNSNTPANEYPFRFGKGNQKSSHHTPCSVHSEFCSSSIIVDSIYDVNTGTWQYVVADARTLCAVIIDPVLDYDAAAQIISTTTADRLASLIDGKGYRVLRILETHVHADHLTAASYLQSTLARKQGLKPTICIGKRIRKVQETFAQRYGVSQDELEGAFDQLMEDGEVFQVGDLEATVIHLPGHTPDHVGYIIGGWSHSESRSCKKVQFC